ncbi:lipocalin-like domain-containing protein [Ferruginibacter sp.]|nr:hypothetical protein [Ferruginibacter sp.]
MKKIIFFLVAMLAINICTAQSPVGKWKVVSHVSEFQGKKFDSHKALLQQRPCVAKVFYEINTDGTYRLNAAASGCEDRYNKIQEKLHSEEVWNVKGNIITIGNKKAPTVGQTYTFTVSGNKMTWVGAEGQGTITYQKL